MNYLQRYLVDEFVEDYQEGHLSRRQALKRIAGITGMAVAAQILAACGEPATPSDAVDLPTSSAAAPTSAPAADTAPTAAPTGEAATAAPTTESATAAPTTAT